MLIQTAKVNVHCAVMFKSYLQWILGSNVKHLMTWILILAAAFAHNEAFWAKEKTKIPPYIDFIKVLSLLWSESAVLSMKIHTLKGLLICWQENECLQGAKSVCVKVCVLLRCGRGRWGGGALQGRATFMHLLWAILEFECLRIT